MNALAFLGIEISLEFYNNKNGNIMVLTTYKNNNSIN